jgi:hypothetical protein
MIWRELIIVRNGQITVIEQSHPFVPDLQKMKHLTFKNTKKIIYVILFITLKFFIKFSNLIKNTSILLIKKLKDKLTKKKNELGEIVEKKEVSKYLRMISEYRHKIRQMKHRIKEEEGIE